MSRIVVQWLMVLAILFPLSGNGQPKIGLVLSGGGAKGIAHIGVLQELEANGIYADVVTGTSMGSIVGGLYSLGYSADELAVLATSVEWDGYFNDSYARSSLPIEEKERIDRYQLRFPIEKGKLQLPRGFIQGKKIQTLLSGLTTPSTHFTTFDDYPRPFRCVATNLATGQAHVFSDGSLADAMRASMSIPSVFEPYEINDALLVDGFLVRNLPVQEAIALGADFTIAVDVGAPLSEKDGLGSAVAVIDQLSNFLTVPSTDAQRVLADFIFDPQLKGLGAADFAKAETLIAYGRETGKECVGDLIWLLEERGIELPMEKPVFKRSKRDSFWISEVVFEGDTPATERSLDAVFRTPVPDTLSLVDLEQEVGKLYGSGFFSSVNYALTQAEDSTGYRLKLTAEGLPKWSIAGGVNYDNTYNAGLLLNLTGRNIGLAGSVFSLEGRISENPAAYAEYLIYTRSNPSVGLRLFGSFAATEGAEYFNGARIESIDQHDWWGKASFLSGFRDQFNFQLGGFARSRRQTTNFFLVEPETLLKEVGGFVLLTRETLDRTYFPKTGSHSWMQFQYAPSGTLNNSRSPEGVRSMAGNMDLRLQSKKVFPMWKRGFLDFFMAGGARQFPQYDFSNLYYLGREMPLENDKFEIYGLRHMEVPASIFGSARLHYRHELGVNNFIGLGYQHSYFVQSELGALDYFEATENYIDRGHLNGIGLEVGSLTRLGPLRFTVEYGLESESFNASFFAGWRF